MKRITIIAAIALVALTSCTKQKTYVCTIEQTTPEGIVYHTTATEIFTGTYRDMKAFEAARNWGTPGTGSWQTCTCK